MLQMQLHWKARSMRPRDTSSTERFLCQPSTKYSIKHPLSQQRALDMSSITLTIGSPAYTSSDHTSDTAQPRRKPRVSAEHTLNRVRENQRRHRARQRDRVASLESQLAEMEKQLIEAKAEIARLKAERETENTICRYSHIPTTGAAITIDEIGEVNAPQSIPIQGPVAPVDQQFQYLDHPDLSFLAGTISPGFVIELNDTVPARSTSASYTGPPPCCSDPPTLPGPDEPVDPECSTCKTRPLPDPSESTTLCAQAFVLISQQNFRNLDPGTIRSWLAQGLRRAQRDGEGCRVENGALMRLLDYISGI